MRARFILYTLICAVTANGAIFAAESEHRQPAGGRGSSAERSLSTIAVDVQAALRAEAVGRRRSENSADVLRLVGLFGELASHPKRDESLVAWELGVKLRSRLREVSSVVERRGGAEKRAKEVGVAAVRVGGAPDQDGRAILADDQVGRDALAASRILAQQLPPPRAPGQIQGAAPPVAQPAAGQVVDYGPQLVELIQQTISPGTWNINGGPGAVVYYQPLRVLVVSAPDDVQNQIGGVVGQLRRP